MDWDFEAPPKPASRKLLTRLGRRNTHTTTTQEEFKIDDDILESPVSLSSGKSGPSDGPVAPPRSRKTGWGDELKSGKQRVAVSINEQDKHYGRDNRDRDEEIPVIPDLDEIIEDNSISEINSMISNTKNRVAAYKELDSDFLKKASFATVDGIDLSLLAEKLYPAKMVQEADEVWNWDTLFTQITSEINSQTRTKSNF